MKYSKRFFAALTLALIFLSALLAACGAQPITPTPTATPTNTATPFPDSACGWNWAYEGQPELTEQWRTAMINLSLPFIMEQTSVYAFGENCFDQSGKVIRFAGMETDFNVSLTMQDLNDLNERAALIEPVMRLVLDSFSTVSPRPGFVEFHLQSATAEQYLRVTIASAQGAIADGKTGIDFYNAVTSQP